MSYVSLRLLNIPSEKCHCCHHKACLCDEICKEWSDILGIDVQNIQQLAVCCLETQFFPYVFTCFSWSGVLRPVAGRAVWQPDSVCWCLERADTINPMELRDRARHVHSIQPLEQSKWVWPNRRLENRLTHLASGVMLHSQKEILYWTPLAMNFWPEAGVWIAQAQ